MRTYILLLIVITAVIGGIAGKAASNTVNKAMNERAELLANI